MPSPTERELLDAALGIDDALAIEASALRIRIDNRRYGKAVTIIDGFDASADIKHIASELKRELGTGGTAKDGQIELQGDHKKDVREILTKRGYRLEA